MLTHPHPLASRYLRARALDHVAASMVAGMVVLAFAGPPLLVAWLAWLAI